MGLRDWFAKKKQPSPTGPSQDDAAGQIIDRKYVGTGRKAVETTRGGSESAVYRSIAEYHGYDVTSLITMSSYDLLKIIFVIDPTASHALSNFLRIFDTGYFATAVDFEGNPDETAQVFLDSVLSRHDRPTSEGFSGDTSIRSFCCRAVTLGMFTGAVAAEVVFEKGFVNTGIHLVEPSDIDFIKRPDSTIFPRYVGGGAKVDMDTKNFIYFPIDPLPGDVYGTSQFISCIQPIMNKIRLLQDFARALRNLGFDRLDITIDEEALIEACRKKGIKDPEKIEAVINSVVERARTSLASLEVDDNPAHLSSIKLSALEGKNGRQLDLKAIVDVMMSDIASGLKMFATIIGKSFNRSSEGYQSIEALLFVAMVQGFQGFIARFMERILSLIVQVEGGFPCNVDFSFLEPSIRPKYESAQYYAGYQTMVDAAEKLGHVSQAEASRLVRRMLSLKGDPPPDAQRVENQPAQNDDEVTPERDRSQENGKEEKRARTRAERRTSPDK